MSSTVISHASFVALALLLPVLGAQDPQAGQPQQMTVTPANPPASFRDWKAFLAEAAKRNSIDQDDLLQWHLRATYKLYDSDGKPGDEGVFEEYRAGDNRFRVSYKSPSYSHVVYGTGRADRAVFIDGADGSSQT